MGVASVAPDTSPERTAYPSIEELSKEGSGQPAITSSARTHPWQSARGNSSGSRTVTLAITRSRYSSTDSMPEAYGQATRAVRLIERSPAAWIAAITSWRAVRLCPETKVST